MNAEPEANACPVATICAHVCDLEVHKLYLKKQKTKRTSNLTAKSEDDLLPKHFSFAA